MTDLNRAIIVLAALCLVAGVVPSALAEAPEAEKMVSIRLPAKGYQPGDEITPEQYERGLALLRQKAAALAVEVQVGSSVYVDGELKFDNSLTQEVVESYAASLTQKSVDYQFVKRKDTQETNQTAYDLVFVGVFGFDSEATREARKTIDALMRQVAKKQRTNDALSEKLAIVEVRKGRLEEQIKDVLGELNAGSGDYGLSTEKIEKLAGFLAKPQKHNLQWNFLAKEAVSLAVGRAVQRYIKRNAQKSVMVDGNELAQARKYGEPEISVSSVGQARLTGDFWVRGPELENIADMGEFYVPYTGWEGARKMLNRLYSVEACRIHPDRFPCDLGKGVLYSQARCWSKDKTMHRKNCKIFDEAAWDSHKFGFVQDGVWEHDSAKNSYYTAYTIDKYGKKRTHPWWEVWASQYLAVQISLGPYTQEVPVVFLTERSHWTEHDRTCQDRADSFMEAVQRLRNGNPHYRIDKGTRRFKLTEMYTASDEERSQEERRGFVLCMLNATYVAYDFTVPKKKLDALLENNMEYKAKLVHYQVPYFPGWIDPQGAPVMEKRYR